MELQQVTYVLGVVDHGTFTAAAAAAGVSQPALSQGIRALERDLGIELFHRVGRSVVLSEAGRAFVPHARQLVADARRATEAVGRVLGLQGGTLELVSLATLAVVPLVELIGGFRDRHPQVHVRVREHEGGSDGPLTLVQTGDCELGLVDLPDREAPQGLITHELRRQEFLAVCPPGTLKASATAITVAELAHLPLVATPKGTSSRQILDDAFTESGVDEPFIAVESWHRELLGPLVLSGAAAAVLPAPMAAQARELGAEVASLDPPITRTIGLVHRSGPLSPAAQAFLDLGLRAMNVN